MELHHSSLHQLQLVVEVEHNLVHHEPLLVKFKAVIQVLHLALGVEELQEFWVVILVLRLLVTILYLVAILYLPGLQQPEHL
jgi:hypothetical protein